MAKKNIQTRVRGTTDLTPEATPVWRYVEELAADVFSLYGFEEMRTPIFEKTEIFARSIGEATDIVEKEMYTFTDRGGESLTLRPEGTASMVRAVIENGMVDRPGLHKLFYSGPMFRAERPQAGRFRQFHQIGAEVFGAADPAVDAELIIMLMDFFAELKVPGLKVILNSLGDEKCRPVYREALTAFLKERADKLCESCQGRIDRNPLRVLDCKSEHCQAIVAEAPTIDQSRCDDCNRNLDKVRRPLLDLEVPHIIDPKLVRGLDYYTGAAFEIVAEGLGAQNAVAGGGRYDGLVESFGGPPTPATGFAIGVERLVSLLPQPVTDQVAERGADIFMILLGDAAEERSFELAHRLRSYGYRVERSFDGASAKSQMKKADRSGARFSVIIGENEVAQGAALVKDMESGEQRPVPFTEIVDMMDDLFDQAAEGLEPGREEE